jgi:hypothetical protein
MKANNQGTQDFTKPLVSLLSATTHAQRLLYSAIEHGPTVAPLDLPPEIFPTRDLQAAARVIRAAWLAGNVGQAGVIGFASAQAATKAEQDAIAVTLIEVCGTGFPEDPRTLYGVSAAIREFDRGERRRELSGAYVAATSNGSEAPDIVARILALEAEVPDDGLEVQLQIRAFDFANHPPMPHPIFKITGSVLCTEGNLTNIQAPPKAGKTAVMESMIAAVMNRNRQGPDTLGFSAENPKGHALIHIDTEQSQYDHDALIRRAMRRAQIDSPPPWLSSYALVDLSVNDRRKAVSTLMERAQRDHGGVFAVMIDGIGDLCFDPNDSAEAFDLVNHLHSLAVTHRTTVCTVLHENPGSESGKTRGHLGSQLERKAETNLRLAKDKAGVTAIWAEKARHLYLPRDHGACFAWNNGAQMHTSCGSAGEIKQASARDKARGEAESAFNGSATLRHTGLVAAIGEALDLQEKASKNRVKAWTESGIIRKDGAGNYHLSTP